MPHIEITVSHSDYMNAKDGAFCKGVVFIHSYAGHRIIGCQWAVKAYKTLETATLSAGWQQALFDFDLAPIVGPLCRVRVVGMKKPLYGYMTEIAWPGPVPKDEKGIILEELGERALRNGFKWADAAIRNIGWLQRTKRYVIIDFDPWHWEEIHKEN